MRRDHFKVINLWPGYNWLHTPFTARNVNFAELETDREQRSFQGHTEGIALSPFVHDLNSELCIFTYLVLM